MSLTSFARRMQTKRPAERLILPFLSQASVLIDTIVQRRRDNLCTVAQARLLVQFGASPDLSFKDASALISRIAANGWQPLG